MTKYQIILLKRHVASAKRLYEEARGKARDTSSIAKTEIQILELAITECDEIMEWLSGMVPDDEGHPDLPTSNKRIFGNL